MPRSFKIFIGMLVFIGITIPIGFINNKKVIYDFNPETNIYDKEKIDNDLKNKNLQEQKEELSEYSTYEQRGVHKEDENSFIGERILTQVPDENIDGMYIKFSNKQQDAQEVRKILKKYESRKNSYDYKIIYLDLESSLVTGSQIVSGNLGLESSIYDIPTIIIVENGKLIFGTNNFKEIPDKGEIT